jgi:acetyl esterase/lipase
LSSRDILTLPCPAADARITYGSQPRQFADLRIPGSPDQRRPVVITIHGGFWRNQFNLTYMGHLCTALKRLGIATWNIEFRSIGDRGGAWPGTFDDVAAAAAHLRTIAGQYHLDLDRTIALGHSAGGHLGLWLSSKTKLRGVVGLGAVADIGRARKLHLSNGVVDLLHAPASGDPMQILPLHTSQRLFHGKDDDIVPIDLVRRYVDAAQKKGDDAKLIELDGGHFEPVDPRTKQWAAVAEEVRRLLRASA